jgi:hypothetical protein
LIVNNCANCPKEVVKGEMMFPVYWSVEYDSGDVELRFICLHCFQDAVREPRTPGGRI